MNNHLIDLLTEFDETSFAPITTCPDAEGAAIAWKESIMKEIEALETENAALRERLKNAVELPCKIGDIMYQVFSKTQDKPIAFSVEKIRVMIQSDMTDIYVEEISGSGGTIGRTAFNRKSAEAHLAELKEGK